MLKGKKLFDSTCGKKECVARKFMTLCNVSFIIYIEVPVPIISYTYDLFSSLE